MNITSNLIAPTRPTNSWISTTIIITFIEDLNQLCKKFVLERKIFLGILSILMLVIVYVILALSVYAHKKKLLLGCGGIT